MNVKIVSTWKCKCGIAVYSLHLRNALRELGVQSEVVDIRQNINAIIGACQNAHVIHIQHEPMFCSMDVVSKLAQTYPEIPIVVTMHRIERELAVFLSKYSKKIVVLRNTPAEMLGLPTDKLLYEDMGTPVLPVIPKQKARADLGLPMDSTIISTFGFLAGWKSITPVVKALAPVLKSNPKYHLQLLTSGHFMLIKDSDIEAETIYKSSEEAGVWPQITHLTSFLSDAEIHARLCASDVGFIFAPIHTGSSSAAARRFVAAGVPLVITESNHFEALTKGVLRTTFDLGDFVRGICRVADDEPYRKFLSGEMLGFKEETLWSKVAGEHIKIYESVIPKDT